GRVAADDAGGELAAVLEDDVDPVGSLDHVVVGHDVAVLADEEAGAARLHGDPLAAALAAAPPAGGDVEEAPPLLRDLPVAGGEALGALRLDVDHRRRDGLGDGDE